MSKPVTGGFPVTRGRPAPTNPTPRRSWLLRALQRTAGEQWTGVQELEQRIMYSVASEGAVYDRWVAIESGATAAVLDSAGVLESQLQDMTGVDFNITGTRTSGRGIFLLRTASDLTTRFPALASQSADLATLAGKTSEGFFIYSSGADALYIVGNSDAAIDLGVFYYLNQLGWRQLMPGPNWTVKPQLNSITTAIDSVQDPDFRLRQLAVSGGFGGSLPLDPGQTVEAAYDFWERANLSGGSISGANHAGAEFNGRNLDALKANYLNDPHTDTDQMLAYNNDVAGRTGWQGAYLPDDWDHPVSPEYRGPKPNPSSPALQALYAADRVAKYKEQLLEHGVGSRGAFSVSVEPADGGYYDKNPTTLANFANASDQAFFLAMKAEQALRADPDPDVQNGFVGILGYGFHVMLPTRTDVRNWLADPDSQVYTQVTPWGYAAAHTPLSADELIEAWAAAKPNNLGIYDYWNIPVWTNQEPAENLDENAQRILQVHNLGYDGFEMETGIGAPVGSLMYMATRLMWDATLDPMAMRQEFYSKAFGAAAAPMARMIERWGGDTRFTFSAQELGRSFQDLAEARALVTSDPASLARVDDYAKYVEYLRLITEWKTIAANGGSAAARHAAAQSILQHAWRIHDSGLLNTHIVNEQMFMTTVAPNEAANATVGASGTTLIDDWNEHNDAAWGWNSGKLPALTSGDVATIISNGVAAYATTPNHVPLPQPDFSGTLTPLVGSPVLDGATVETPVLQDKTLNFEFQVPAGLTQLDFKAKTANYGNDQHPAHIIVKDTGGNVVFDNNYGGGAQNNIWHSFTVTGLTAGAKYSMTIVDNNHGVSLTVPKKLPFVLKGSLTSLYTTGGWNAHFYVPTGTATVAVQTDLANTGSILTVKDNSGATVSRSFGTGKGESDYTVAAGQDGKVWSLNNLDIYRPNAKLLNVPQVWSFSAEGMMVPVNAAPTVYAGADKTVATSSTTVAATSIDDRMSGSTTLSHAWSKVSGPGTVTFGTGTALSSTATFSTTGTYVLRLTSEDSASVTGYDDVTVTYVAGSINAAPVVDAGNPATVLITGANVAASLDGTVTDATTPAYKWTKVEGPGAVYFANPTAVDTSATFDAPGTYRLRLAADDGSLEAFDEVVVTVAPGQPTYGVGDTGTFGLGDLYDNSGSFVIDDVNDQFSARFRALETVTIDRVMQRLTGMDASTTIEVGIMADDGNGKPTGNYLASTGTFDPGDGDTTAWAVFTGSLQLDAGKVYHLVTKMINDTGAFNVARSSVAVASRPHDRANDPQMAVVTKTNTGGWVASNLDPFFTFGMGSTPTIVPGLGQAYATSLHNGTWSLKSLVGTGKAMGQRFTVSTREVASTNRVVMTGLTLQVYKQNSPQDLVLKVRHADGTVLGTITVPAASIATTTASYTWPFDGGTEVWLTPGDTYFLTSEFAANGESGNYQFRALSAPAAIADNTWGGTATSYPIESAASANWAGYNWASPTPYTPTANIGSNTDLMMSFTGTVVPAPAYGSTGSGAFGQTEKFGNTAAGQTMNALTRMYSARFTPRGNITIDRAVQRLIGVDSGTRLEVGIMADNGNGEPDGRFLVSTGSYDPADGNSSAWATFTQSLDLIKGKVYHLVTKMTAKGGSDAFTIGASAGSTDVRAYDRGIDASMTYLTSSDTGGTWATATNEPFFVLGNGSTPTLVTGAGQPNNGAVTNRLITYGDEGKAMGQKFTIFNTELSPNTTVTVSEMTFNLFKSASTAHDLVLKLRDSSGTVLATITKPASGITTSSAQYTWGFDGGATANLVAGKAYFITSEISGSTASDAYSFKGLYADADHKATTWGGTTNAVPVQSAASNSWAAFNWSSPTTYPARDDSDLWFGFTGTLSHGGSGIGFPLDGGGGSEAFGGEGLLVSSMTQGDAQAEPSESTLAARLLTEWRKVVAQRSGTEVSWSPDVAAESDGEDDILSLLDGVSDTAVAWRP